MSVDTGDLGLVQRVQKGDKTAFDLLVRKYQHKVVKLVTRYLRDPRMRKTWHRKRSSRHIGPFPSFAGTVPSIPDCTASPSTRRRTPSSRATAIRVEFDLDMQNVEESSPCSCGLRIPETPESLLQTEEIRETVNRAIEALPEDLRTAIVLRELEGLSYEDIAQAMDCPVGTVRSRIFARAKPSTSDCRKYSKVDLAGLRSWDERAGTDQSVVRVVRR